MTENTKEEVRCPTCGRTDFKSQRGVYNHHSYEHDESLVKETEICKYCGEEFDYHPHVDFDACKACRGYQIWKDRETLIEYYINRELTQQECADKFGCHITVIRRWLKRKSVPIRNKARGNLYDLPRLSKRDHQIIKGIFMGDGCVTKESNPYLKVTMINEEFLNWLDKELGDITAGVVLTDTAKQKAKKNRKSGFHSEAKEENYSDQYTLRTYSHPGLNEYSNWYHNGRKRFPENLKLTPLTVKMWYVTDGCMDTSNEERGGRPCIRIGCLNESDRKDYIDGLFDDIGFNCNYNGHSILFSVEESERLWEYMGDPAPGFERKWPNEQ